MVQHSKTNPSKTCPVLELSIENDYGQQIGRSEYPALIAENKAGIKADSNTYKRWQHLVEHLCGAAKTIMVN